MAFDFGHAFGGRALPQNLSGLLVEAIDLPGMLRQILVRIDVAVKAVPEFALRRAADGSDDEKFIVPDNRACVGQSGDCSLPDDVFVLLGIPGGGRFLAIGGSRSIGASE